MSANSNSRDQEYYRRRELQEREHAARAEDTAARRVHLEMAEHYFSLLQNNMAGASATAA